MTDSRFYYAAPQIVGTASCYEYLFNISPNAYGTTEGANSHGLHNLQHDDFVVAEVKGEKVVAIYAANEKRDDLLGDYGPGIASCLDLECAL